MNDMSKESTLAVGSAMIVWAWRGGAGFFDFNQFAAGRLPIRLQPGDEELKELQEAGVIGG